MSFLDVFSLFLSLPLSLSLFHPTTDVYPPSTEKEERGTEIKKESPTKVLTSLHLTSQPHLCVFIIKPIFCVVCLS